MNNKYKNMKKLLIVTGITAFLFSCGGNEAGKSGESQGSESAAKNAESVSSAEMDAKRGVGKFTKVDISPTLDTKMAEAGTTVYDVKCASCHKLTDERLVGPGWKGVTQRRTAEWIMNFATNTDEMLAKDPEAQAQLEVCLVRMPNQNLTDDDARHVYEYMRKNDGVK